MNIDRFMAACVKIEKGLPLPPKRNERNWPLAEMTVGDSFLIPADVAIGSTADVYTLARNLHIQVAIRATEHGLRVWRTA